MYIDKTEKHAAIKILSSYAYYTIIQLDCKSLVKRNKHFKFKFIIISIFSHRTIHMLTICIDEDIDIDELKDTIQYKICIWDSCHESDLGVIYCTCDDIKITDNVLTINTNGKHVYGSMTEYAYDNELEFEMFVPFNK